MLEQIKSSNGISLVPLETSLLSHRKVFVEGEIDQKSANEFVKEIALLNIQDNKRHIDVLIDSPGGEVRSGLMMYDAIQASKAPIRMYCLGRAYSMAALLLASGNNGRYILPHGEAMIHEPLLGNRVGGNSSSIKGISDMLINTTKMLNSILAKHTGKTLKEIEEATSYDHYLSAEESVKFGLCDEVVDFNQILGV